jgi:hypothetical protein
MKLKIEFNGATVAGELGCSLEDATDALICLGREYPQWAAVIAFAGAALIKDAGGGYLTDSQLKVILDIREQGRLAILEELINRRK